MRDRGVFELRKFESGPRIRNPIQHHPVPSQIRNPHFAARVQLPSPFHRVEQQLVKRLPHRALHSSDKPAFMCDMNASMRSAASSEHGTESSTQVGRAEITSIGKVFDVFASVSRTSTKSDFGSIGLATY